MVAAQTQQGRSRPLAASAVLGRRSRRVGSVEADFPLSGPFTGLRSCRGTRMARNYYSEINLHLTWHTKESLPLLTPQVEPFVHRYVRQRIINTPGRLCMKSAARKPTFM